MKHLFTFFGIIISIQVLAQTNYVANTPAGTTGGSYNTLAGVQSGSINSGEGNVFVGYQSGLNNTSGNYNVFTGYQTGRNNSSGYANTYLGYQAGKSNGGGYGNVFTGFAAGQVNNTGYSNVFIGANAGASNTTGFYNVFTGGSSGNSNVIGRNNVFTGYAAGYSTTEGNGNVFTGYQAGFSNTTGGGNVFTGSNAGGGNTEGNGNVFTGIYAGLKNTTGNNNIFVGYSAGYYNTTGSNNIIIGPNSGTAITTSDDNVLMGYNSQADDGLQNAIAIGANSRVAISNALILGNGVNVGIGTSAPTARLEVVSDKADDSGLRLTSLTGTSRTTAQTDQFLTVDGQGNVIKARYQLRIQDPAQWSDTVFSPGYSLRSLPAIEAYVQQNGHLPDVPSAEEVASKGVDLVKMNALLLQKIEELTLHMIELQKQVDQLRKEKERKD